VSVKLQFSDISANCMCSCLSSADYGIKSGEDEDYGQFSFSFSFSEYKQGMSAPTLYSAARPAAEGLRPDSKVGLTMAQAQCALNPPALPPE